MAMANISTLSTENTDVARLVIAHNAATQILDAYQVGDVTRDQLADLYVTYFDEIYAAVQKKVAPTAVRAV
jgi:hypothetical protein